MLQFLKKWRQAFQSERAQRLHAEQEKENNALCHNNDITLEEVGYVFEDIERLDKIKSWIKALTTPTPDDETQVFKGFKGFK